MKTVILKFGGASVANPSLFSSVADIIIERSKKYDSCVVVVSAMGDTTNQLIALARNVHVDPPKRELDMLVSVGERVSISLLAMALSVKGVEAISFTGSQSGIITSDEHTEAKIIDLKPRRILEHLGRKKIVIVAGFQGVSRCGEITTLGRGGSDTSAVALAAALRAEKVEFYKDVKGMYSKDPKLHSDAFFYSQLSYDSAIEIVQSGAKILHQRSLDLAKKNSIPLHILSFSGCSREKNEGTLIRHQGDVKGPSSAIFE
ncbi:MAG: aspartate kinase [Chlamydiae bacterium]|nr:aspartate kinase [Chlamydiota bacterium]